MPVKIRLKGWLTVWLFGLQGLHLEKPGQFERFHDKLQCGALTGTHYRLAKDQTEINRIISEVSKGSKFYEVLTSSNILCISIKRGTLQNEKKKDMELTVRIDKILKQRDEAIRGVDLRKCFVTFSIASFFILCLQVRSSWPPISW